MPLALWSRRSFRYATAGAALALGAPLGWLALRFATGQRTGSPLEELTEAPLLYAYLLIGTVAVFGLFGFGLGVLSDRLVALNQRLEQLSVTDALTSLKNTRYFHERLAEEVARAGRTGHPLSLVMVDLDHFKAVNDRHGHPFGDRVLAETAARLLQCARTSDVACRVGGEEFALILPGASAADAAEISERIRRAVEERPIEQGPRRVTVTASFGVAALDATGAAGLAARADEALYHSKRSGRNRVTVDGGKIQAVRPDSQAG